MGAGARAEYLQDQAGAVDDLGFQLFLKIALLHWSQRAVDHDDADAEIMNDPVQPLQMAGADQGRRTGLAQGQSLGVAHLEIDRDRQTNGFLHQRVKIAHGALARARRIGRAGQDGVNDEGCPRRGVGSGGQSSPSFTPSNSWIGMEGMMVEIACL